MNKYLIIDFDSTINKLEALDELAKIVDSRNGNSEISTQIKAITEQGMLGNISFVESLELRMKLLKFRRTEMEILIKLLKENFSDSFLDNIQTLEKFSTNIIIISGGFKDFIVPALSEFKILSKNIYANKFVFNATGNCIGFDRNNYLTKEKGKVQVVKSLNLKGEVIVIGDGFTDYQIKESGYAQKFIAFTENVSRANVIEKADLVAKNFGDVIDYILQ